MGNLSFANCKRVTDAGSAVLVQKMPKGIARAAVNLAGTLVNQKSLRWQADNGKPGKSGRTRTTRVPSNGITQPLPRHTAPDGAPSVGREPDVPVGSLVDGAAPSAKAVVRLPSIGIQLSSGGDSGLAFDDLGEGDLGSKGQATRIAQKQKQQKGHFRAFR